MFKASFSAALLMLCAATAHANIIENFDNITDLAAKGFVLRNASTPGGTNGFFQGNSLVFGAQSGTGGSYLGENFESAAPGGMIDNWFISPEFSNTYGGTVSFFIRAADEPGYLDTFQYGFSNGGTNAADFGLTLLASVPTADWTKLVFWYGGTSVSNSVARLAIRYTGEADTANYIGIDSLAISVPEPGSALLLGLGLIGVGIARSRGNGCGHGRQAG